jgi:radical SAM protein with 4Fe4S-binding SPASM domain
LQCKVVARAAQVYATLGPVQTELVPTLVKKRFQKIHVEISNICNLQCTFCPEVIRSKKLMDLELFEKIIPQIAPLTEQVAFHLMGEPLLHPKLENFLNICASHELPVFFTSNGVLLTEKRSELLLHKAVRQVNFSLHSFYDNFPDKDPADYLEKIFQFTEAAFEKRPDLYLNYRLWNLQTPNQDTDRNRDFRARIEKRFRVSIPDEVNVRSTKSRRLLNRLYLHYDTEFIWPSLDLPVLGESGTCYGLSSHFGILADGTVVPCCLDKEGSIPLGNVKDAAIESILASPETQAILTGFQKRKLVNELCKRCNYIKRFK